VAGRVFQLANALLDGGGAAEPGIARSGAQMLAASACLGSDSWAGKVRDCVSVVCVCFMCVCMCVCMCMGVGGSQSG